MTKIAVGPRPDKPTLQRRADNRYLLIIDGIEILPVYGDSRAEIVTKVVALCGVPHGPRKVGTHQDRWTTGLADEHTFEVRDLSVEPPQGGLTAEQS